MANTPQAKKRIRRNDRRAEINGNRLGRIRTFVKKVESALDGGDKPVLGGFTAGTAPPGTSVAAPSVVRVGSSASVLAASPGDRAVYQYMEGMNAPAGGYQGYGRDPMAVTASLRGIAGFASTAACWVLR